jgi:hypothetical protein
VHGMRHYILPIYEYFNKMNYKENPKSISLLKKKKPMAQRQKHLQKSSFKFKKSKVNNVILLYKNNAKTYPFLQGLCFYRAPKIISIILLCKLKEKEEKNLNKRLFFCFQISRTKMYF